MGCHPFLRSSCYELMSYTTYRHWAIKVFYDHYCLVMALGCHLFEDHLFEHKRLSYLLLLGSWKYSWSYCITWRMYSVMLLKSFLITLCKEIFIMNVSTQFWWSFVVCNTITSVDMDDNVTMYVVIYITLYLFVVLIRTMWLEEYICEDLYQFIILDYLGPMGDYVWGGYWIIDVHFFLRLIRCTLQLFWTCVIA